MDRPTLADRPVRFDHTDGLDRIASHQIARIRTLPTQARRVVCTIGVEGAIEV